MTEADLVLTSLCMLIGEQGIDWQYYVEDELYWRKWVELNMN